MGSYGKNRSIEETERKKDNQTVSIFWKKLLRHFDNSWHNHGRVCFHNVLFQRPEQVMFWWIGHVAKTSSHENIFFFFFFLKSGPIPASFSVYFRLFNMLQFKLKKRRWCAWESNPGRQDGRRERIHWATAAPLKILLLYVYKYLPISRQPRLWKLHTARAVSNGCVCKVAKYCSFV